MLRAKLFTLIFLLGSIFSFTFAQDIIYLTDGSSINAQVKRVNLEEDYIYYHESKSPVGMHASISTKYVSAIRFGFGYTRHFSTRTPVNTDGMSRGGSSRIHQYRMNTLGSSRSRYPNLRANARVRSETLRASKPNARITLVDGATIEGDFERISEEFLWYKPGGQYLASSRSISLDLIAAVKLDNGTHLSVNNKYLSIFRNEGIKWANGQATIARNIEIRDDNVRYYRKNHDLAQLYDLESVYKVLLKDHVITVSF